MTIVYFIALHTNLRFSKDNYPIWLWLWNIWLFDDKLLRMKKKKNGITRLNVSITICLLFSHISSRRDLSKIISKFKCYSHCFGAIIYLLNLCDTGFSWSNKTFILHVCRRIGPLHLYKLWIWVRLLCFVTYLRCYLKLFFYWWSKNTGTCNKEVFLCAWFFRIPVEWQSEDLNEKKKCLCAILQSQDLKLVNRTWHEPEQLWIEKNETIRTTTEIKRKKKREKASEQWATMPKQIFLHIRQ